MARGKKISDLTSGTVPLASDFVVIHRGGKNYKLSAEALNALGLLAKNNLSEVASPVTALSNLNGVPLAGPRSLSLYSNVIVVESTYGDYTTLEGAMSAASSGDVIWVFGTIIETNVISWSDGVSVVLAPGSRVEAISSTRVWYQDGVTSGALLGSGTFANPGSEAMYILDDPTTGQMAFTIDGITIEGGSGTFGSTVLKVTQGPILKMRNVRINNTAPSGNTYGMRILTNIPSVTSIFEYCYFVGVGAYQAVTSVAYTDAPFYHCVFINGVHANVTFEASNNSNVEL